MTCKFPDLDDAALERLRMHLVQAGTRARSPQVRRHIDAALAELDGEPVDDQLVECVACGRVGLPAQVASHDCRRH
jgi:endonuclease V-like protein UPF0215 family